jgi:hypothetical protein
MVSKQSPVAAVWLILGFGGAFMTALVSVIFWYVAQLNHWVFW